MKSWQKPRKLWLLPMPLALAALAWFSFPAAMEYFSYRPEVDYRAILRTSPAYNAEPTNLIFTYEAPNSPGLTKLRETYQLDQIAGAGSDFEKAKNLLKWVQVELRHDGSGVLPAQHDALTLISSAKSSGQGLNCRGMAIVLAETLLSVGIPARYVELNPRDFSTESHVVTQAYLAELDKWVFFDPTYGAYFLNAAGQPLSLDEIRASLISGEPLFTNPEINYNGGPVDVDYLNYLAKNLYHLASPQVSAFGIDTAPARTMVVLNPAGDHSERRNPFQAHLTLHNPEVFWAKP